MNRALGLDGAGEMRISRSSYLGVEFLACLADRSGDTPCTAEELARSIERSVSYAETILARLRRAGLVKPLRGPGGGYRLAKKPGSITVAEIMCAVDDFRGTPPALGATERVDGAALLWDSLQRYSLHYLERVTLADIACGCAKAARS
jgi:Rrf2 family transcriptional regulator, iron-sulfur cluster assembly transcription factor